MAVTRTTVNVSGSHRNIDVWFHKQNINNFMLEISQKDGEFKGGKNRFAEREQSKCEIYFELVMSEELTDFFNVQLLFICLCLYKYTKLSLNPLQNSPGGQGDGP